MGNPRHSRSNSIDFLTKGPLAPHVDAYRQRLIERGYSPHTIAAYVGGIAHFAQWAYRQRSGIRRIDEVAVARFLNYHLPHCDCAGSGRHYRKDLSAALGHLLVVLRARGVIDPMPISSTPAAEELRRFDEHLNHVCGLAPATRRMYALLAIH